MRGALLLLIALALWGKSPDFETFRSQERQLVLAEFKKLYKQRRHVHPNLRQALRHARSKTLQKGRLELFQPSSAYFEQSNVYFFEPDESEPPVQAPDVSDDMGIPVDAGIDGESGEETRRPLPSPWVLK